MEPDHHTIRKIILLMLLTLQGSTHGQQDTCSRCYGDYRFEPHIIDLIIEESTDNEVDATIHWNEPSACCDVHYRVDVLSMSHCGVLENCCIAITNTSKANVNLHLSNEGEAFTFQISAIYGDNVVTPGPCHFVNITSYITNSRKYCQEKYTVGNIPIVFESCEPGGAFLPPAYELNGVVMHGSELLTDYISRSQDGGYYFTISNVTEDIVLLEYCIQSSEVLCDICEHSRQDTFLSRSEIDINYNDGNCLRPSAPQNGFLNEVTSTTVMFGCNEGYSPQGTMTAVCGATDTWSPDPAQLECITTTPPTNNGSDSTGGISAAAIAGIVIGVLSLLGVSICILVTVVLVVCVRKNRWKSYDIKNVEYNNNPVLQNVKVN